MPAVVLVVAAGAALFAAAAAAVFGRADLWEWVFYSQSSGANEVHLPIGYWLVAGLWMFAVSRIVRQPLNALLAWVITASLASRSS